jgi:predicted small secreted protein
MKKIKLILLILATGFLLQSCGTIKSGCGGNPIHLGN